MSGLQDTGNNARNRRRALGQLTTMVGGLVLARATEGDGLFDEILAAARMQLRAARGRKKQALQSVQ